MSSVRTASAPALLKINGLDNPVLSALTSSHSQFALTGLGSCRYHPDVAPFGSFRNESRQAYDELAGLTPPGEELILTHCGDFRPSFPQEWHCSFQGIGLQMAQQGELPKWAFPDGEIDSITVLTAADVPEMLALTRLVKPGPFLNRTIELGVYLGIRHNGQLVAMAGERFQTDNFSEISAVCTHPDYQGRGAARRLVAALIRQIQNRGRQPVLHVLEANLTALRAYQSLGFETVQKTLFTRLYPHGIPANS